MEINEMRNILRREKESGIPYFNMSLDIGISETTLYKFMEYNQYTDRTVNKIEEYINGIE